MSDVRALEGIYVGQLDDDEQREFYEMRKRGEAFCDYSHPGGILGLAKVGIVKKTVALKDKPDDPAPV